jgi:hypothetical protein
MDVVALATSVGLGTARRWLAADFAVEESKPFVAVLREVLAPKVLGGVKPQVSIQVERSEFLEALEVGAFVCDEVTARARGRGGGYRVQTAGRILALTKTSGGSVDAGLMAKPAVIGSLVVSVFPDDPAGDINLS